MTMMTPSSMIHPEPMTIGPAIANIVAFGCIIDPVDVEIHDERLEN